VLQTFGIGNITGYVDMDEQYCNLIQRTPHGLPFDFKVIVHNESVRPLFESIHHNARINSDMSILKERYLEAVRVDYHQWCRGTYASVSTRAYENGNQYIGCKSYVISATIIWSPSYLGNRCGE
jgi:hypothetical protein